MTDFSGPVQIIMGPTMVAIGNFARLFCIVGVAAAAIAAPALARGGSGGHGGIISGAPVVTFRPHFGGVHSPAGFASRPRSPAFIPAASIASGRIRGPVQPEVIVMPFGVGAGAIVVPLTVPIVPRLDTATVRRSRVRLPVFVTQYDDTPGFFPGFIAGVPVEAPWVADPPQVRQAPAVTEPETGVPNTTAADANPLPAACHPIPSGYHCDWPS
jgi:hypothetical protein